MAAYKAGLKGITVYREGSREGILQTEDYASKQAPATPKSDQRHTKGPRQRPTRTVGVTERVKTGEGYLYVTINEDDEGLCEVFTTIGKAGGNAAAQSEAISRLISLALRSGVQPREIVKQLKGISGPTPVWDGQGGQVFSTPDAIGKVLERYLDNRDEMPATRKPHKQVMGKATTRATASSAHPTTNITCPECGSNVEHVTGCVVCYNCGWSKC
jgi:ribonucleoside-diphosphate reductase alpha chain